MTNCVTGIKNNLELLAFITWFFLKRWKKILIKSAFVKRFCSVFEHTPDRAMTARQQYLFNDICQRMTAIFPGPMSLSAFIYTR